MAKLTYWVATQYRDHTCYNIRAKTKKECAALVEANGRPGEYDAPKKVTFEYRNAFDLVTECLNEGGGYWES